VAELEDRALLDFLRGDYAPAARAQGSPCPPPGQHEESRTPKPSAPATAPGGISNPAPADAGAGKPPETANNLTYIPVASYCYAIVQYDAASARVVRRVVGLFGDVDCAETYARDAGYHLYDLLTATAVIATAS